MRTDLGLAHSRLDPPVVIGAGLAFSGPGVRLAGPAATLNDVRRLSHSELRPPTVVFPFVPAQFGPKTRLVATSVRDVVVRRAPFSKLRGPVVVFAVPLAPPIRTDLAPQKRGRPASVLRPPTVVFPSVAPFTARPIAIKLAVQATVASLRRRRPQSALGRPQVVFAPTSVTVGAPGVSLATIRPPRVMAELRPPTVVNAIVTQTFSGPTVHLAPSSRGRPFNELRAPVVIGAGIVFRPIQIELVPSRRGVPKSHLAPPAVIGAGIYFYPVSVTLALSARGKPSSHLFPPVIPPVARPVETEIAVQLVRAEVVQRQPHSRLSPPAVVGAGIYFYPVRVTLAPQKRGAPKSAIRPPVVVGAAAAFHGPQITLAPSRRVIPKSVLRAPIIPPLARPIEVTLARLDLIRRQPHPELRAPAVIGAGIVFRPVDVTLVRSSDISRRRRALTELRPPTVVQAVGAVLPLEIVWLAPQTRGKTRSELSPPAVVGAGRVFRALDVTLAPSKFPRPKSHLYPPAVVGKAPFRPIEVTLVRGRAGTPRSVLRVPIIPPLAEPTRTTLVPQPDAGRRRQGRSELRSPTVVNAPFVAKPVVTHLAYSRRGKPISKLGLPVIPSLASPITVVLAPASRGRSFSRLFAPVKIEALARPTEVSVVRVTLAQRQPHSALRAPAVVRASVIPRPVQVSLGGRVKSEYERHAPHSKLSPPQVVTHPEANQAQQTILVRLVAVRTRAELIQRRPRFVLYPPGGGRALKLSADFPVSAWSTGRMIGAMTADIPDESMTTGEPTSASDAEEPESGWTAGEPF